MYVSAAESANSITKAEAPARAERQIAVPVRGRVRNSAAILPGPGLVSTDSMHQLDAFDAALTGPNAGALTGVIPVPELTAA
jgi:hypothetical protein